jgi:DNA repair photolyase
MFKVLYDKKRPFYLDKGRAMISLGPLNEKRYCAFKCAFCYVQDGFNSYAKLNIDEIILFLKNNQKKYKIIYVSGDTDSFAAPRTDKALELLYNIAIEINCDLLFTTRTTFSEEHYQLLKIIVDKQKQKNKILYACVSITRLSDDYVYLEPKPIPTPKERIGVLEKLKQIGAVTILAIRPFLPVVAINDYLNIIDDVKDNVDIVLGESFYFIHGGAVEKRVFPNGIAEEWKKDILKNQIMSFDKKKNPIWNIWQATKVKNIVQLKCDKLGLIFSMHSDDAIKEFRYIKNLNAY